MRRLALLVLALAALPSRGVAADAAKFKLKPGATGAACLECHVDFAGVMKKPVVHTPVRTRQCTGCHAPHASDHKKLLAGGASASCSGCHDVVPKAAKSAHKPVADGKCTACHDPHAAPAKFNLVKAGNDLCASCHKEAADAAAQAKFKHKPVQSGCVTCHAAHGSAGAPDILKKEVPALCLGCHKAERSIFAKQHLGYDVSKSDCTSCHDPHGSSRRGLLYEKVHSPVAKGMCAQCHDAAGSPNALQVKQAGVALCKGCHNQKVNGIFDKNRLHAPVVAGAGCLSCHTPHASKKGGLLKGEMVSVCASCHADTVRRQEMSPTKHQPVADGDCTTCHDPHSGNRALLLTSANALELCGACHSWTSHSSHPLGEKAKDPRNRNLTLDCLSCHRAHGTEYKRLFPYPTQTDLCVKCHASHKR